MKENKYRGLTLDTKEWVYGNLIIDNAYDLKDGIHKPKPLRVFIKEQCIKWNNKEKCWEYHSFEVDPESIGQFVCLDENNKEIFEGANNIRHDLYHDQLATMVWSKEDLGWKLFFPLTHHKSYIRLDKQLERAENIELIEETK